MENILWFTSFVGVENVELDLWEAKAFLPHFFLPHFFLPHFFLPQFLSHSFFTLFAHSFFSHPNLVRPQHEKQRSSQRKCTKHLSNLPSHHDNATHQGISISQPCYEEKCMECLFTHTFLSTFLSHHTFYAHKWAEPHKILPQNWIQPPKRRKGLLANSILRILDGLPIYKMILLLRRIFYRRGPCLFEETSIGSAIRIRAMY